MKVLLVDDHPLVLAALQAVIQSIGSATEVVGVDNAPAARAALSADPHIDLVLLDLALGEESGFDVLVEFRAAYPAIPVVVVSASDRASDVIRAIDSGAMGFVPKSSSHAELHEALKMVMTGAMYVPPSMLGLEFGRGLPRDFPGRSATPPSPAPAGRRSSPSPNRRGKARAFPTRARRRCAPRVGRKGAAHPPRGP